jgi:hypothetical protein
VQLARVFFLGFVFLIFAQRALWAAAILARADVESFLVGALFAYVWPKAANAAVIPRSSLVKRSCSLFDS